MTPPQTPKIKPNLPQSGGGASDFARCYCEAKLKNPSRVGSRSRKCRIFLILLISLFFVVAGGVGVSAACPEGMVSYWTFDDADLNASDDPTDYMGVNNGTNVGATTGVSGQVGEAFDFDGEDDYVALGTGDIVEGLSATTISAWIKTSQTTRGFIAGETYWTMAHIEIGLHGPGTLRAAFDASGPTTFDTTEAYNNNNWHHVVGTYNGTNAKLYINGVLNGTGADTSGSIATADRPSIGAFMDGVGGTIGYFNGSIDEVAIFNRALNSSEISDLYDLGVAGDGYCEEGFGNLTTYWVTPVTDTNVQQNEFFKVQIGVNCTGGACGDVNVTLDPEEVKKAIEDYKAQQDIITGEVVEEVEDEMNFFEMIIDFIKGVFGR